MDIKMGTRTYLKNEVVFGLPKVENTFFAAEEFDSPRGPFSKDGRPRLPGASPWGGQTTGCNKREVIEQKLNWKIEDHSATRYLAWRDTKSSSATLGLRIEGTTINGKSSRDYKATCTKDQVSKVLCNFIGNRRNRVRVLALKYFSINPKITCFKTL